MNVSLGARTAPAGVSASAATRAAPLRAFTLAQVS